MNFELLKIAGRDIMIFQFYYISFSREMQVKNILLFFGETY